MDIRVNEKARVDKHNEALDQATAIAIRWVTVGPEVEPTASPGAAAAVGEFGGVMTPGSRLGLAVGNAAGDAYERSVPCRECLKEQLHCRKTAGAVAGAAPKP